MSLISSVRLVCPRVRPPGAGTTTKEKSQGPTGLADIGRQMESDITTSQTS